MSDHSALPNVGDGAFFSIDRATLGYQAFLESMSEIVLGQGAEDDVGQSIIHFVDKFVPIDLWRGAFFEFYTIHYSPIKYYIYFFHLRSKPF